MEIKLYGCLLTREIAAFHSIVEAQGLWEVIGFIILWVESDSFYKLQF